MTHSTPALAAGRRAFLILGLMLAVLVSPDAVAAPWAHGPDGEHLEAPAASSASAEPGFEARSELFEVVGRLHAEELLLFIDRFDSNEPVLGATVEVESAGRKAHATFHADLGDYSVTDAALLDALQEPGQHALVLTVVAGDDADLLDGTLRVGDHPLGTDEQGHSDDGPGWRFWLLVGGGGLVLVVLTAWGIRARRSRVAVQ